MTVSAEHRHVHHGRPRIGVRVWQDVVLAVAVGTARCHRVAAFRGCAMQAEAMRYGLGLVAVVAIDGLQILRVPPAFGTSQVLVTIHARRIGVNGSCAGVCGDED